MIRQLGRYATEVRPGATYYRAKAAVRAVIQEQQARANLAVARRQARRRQVPDLEPSELAAALQRRLAPRRRGRLPVAKGDLHIFLAYQRESWEAILPCSLAPFGQVTDFDFRHAGFTYQNDKQWLRVRDELDRVMLSRFYAAHREHPIDAVVAYTSGVSTSPGTLRAMAAQGAAVFNFCWDDKLSWPGRRLGGRYSSPAAIAEAVDLNLTNAPESVVKYAVRGGLAMFWPEAAHPDVHRPHPSPFEFDVSFVGACYGWRPRFIERLRTAGIRVEAFGRGWPRGPLSDEEMVRLYSRSRINLGFAGVGHSRRLMCLKGRDFEVPMSGGLYLTQDNPELACVYEVGKEIVTYRDEADCARQIRRLLADPSLCEAIRTAGRARCLRDHTYEARWSQLFRVAGLML